MLEEGGSSDWWIARKVLADGRCVYLHTTLFNLRISVSPDVDSLFVEQFYCFHSSIAAFQAIAEWNGEGDPEGWVRHVPSNRRRPDGDPEDEYIQK